MENSVFIALINPAVCAILATALFAFWYSQPKRVYVAVLSAGFLLLAIAFAAQYVSVLSGEVASRLAANALLIVGAAVVAAGTIKRYRPDPPLLPLAAIVAVSVSAFAWYLLAEPDIVIRILIINFACGFLVFTVLPTLWKVERKKPIDLFLLALFVVWAMQFFLRPLLAVGNEPLEITDSNLFTTLYWVTLTFSVAFFLLIYAVAIVAAIAIDLQEELRTESYTDPLSGLLNRRGFESHGRRLLDGTASSGSPVALILADLDHFKDVNDRFGHAAGDRAIETFARCLREVLGEEHPAGRIGGEEFAVLLASTDLRTARMVAEGLRASFASLSVPGIPSDCRLSASYGVAVRGPDEDWETLMRRADRTLYDAKARGRDRVVVSHGRRPEAEAPASAGQLRQRVSEA